MMRDFKTRHQLAVLEQRRTDTGTECDSQLQPLALNRSVTLDGSVIGHTRWFAKSLSEFRSQVDANALGAKIGSRENHTVLDNPRKAAGDPFEGTFLFRELRNRVED